MACRSLSFQVTERLEKLKEALERDVESVKELQAELEKEMAALKAQLYGKFGNNINLESDDTD